MADFTRKHLQKCINSMIFSLVFILTIVVLHMGFKCPKLKQNKNKQRIHFSLTLKRHN